MYKKNSADTKKVFAYQAELFSYIKIVYILLSQVYLTLHDEGCYHIETNPLICRANQWTGFYMIMASVMKELKIGTA